MEDLTVQMTALDDFVTSARSENAGHHAQHSTSVNSLTETVGGSFSDISSRYKETFARMEGLSTDVAANVNHIQGGIGRLNDDLCQPLGKLRQDITSTSIRAYEPTGETPEKVNYHYPSHLPRTAPHDTIIASMHDNPNAQTPSKMLATPSKRTPILHAQVFNDNDASEQARSPSRPTSSDSTTQNAPGSSLREMQPNLTTTSLKLEPSTRALSAVPYSDENSMTATKSSTSRTIREGRAKRLRLEGVENLPPSELPQSNHRRRSPRKQ